MDNTKLLLFTRLAETKSFNRCAQQEHVSPSKLSRVIQSMEEELGVSLFNRNNRHVELSEDGKLFLAFAREQLHNWETLQSKLQERSGTLSGSVSIYCSVTASYSFLYKMLTEFRAQHPLIQIKVHTGDPADAIERVTNGHEDIAITAKPDSLPADLSFKQFDVSPLVLISAIDDTHFEDILNNEGQAGWNHIPMIVSERGLARKRFDHWVQENKITPNIYAQVSGNEAIVSMVSLGFGVGLIPQIVLENSPLKQSVEKFAVQPNIAPYKVGTCVQSRRLHNPLVNALWQAITHQ